MNVFDLFGEDASGVIANRKQANDPRYSMSLSPDVRPGEVRRQLKKYNLVEGEANTARLDRVLVDLCAGIIKHQKQDAGQYGLVAAAVVDPDHNVVYGINNLQSNGKRVHAERAAIDNYKQKIGDIPEGSVIVTTLSPCTEPMADREGISCSELIDTTPIRRVYAGYRDPSQDHLVHDDFDVVITNNDKLQQLCKGFADCFLKEPVTEDTDVDSVAQEFIAFVDKRLNFKTKPNVRFVEHVAGTEHPTFGSFDSNTGTISIGTTDRHVMDIMRTLAHELVHHKQRETKPQDQLDGGTASQDENQANSVAGTLMREFADQHPEYFGDEVNVWENFADGKHPEDKGDSKRHHVPTKASVSTLRKVAKQGGRKGQLAHWMANMKAGRTKARKR
jgi:pyrimidine deaminase RibD-like protein